MSWGGYRNGEIPFGALVEVEPGKGLQPDAARTYLEMKSDCLAAVGATFYMANNSNPRYNQQAYRPKADPYPGSQQYFWDHHVAWGIAAAKPGTSNHGWALAADLTFGTTRVRTWFRANCGRYGWANAGDAFGEDWHKEYRGTITPAGAGTRITEREDDDMAVQLIIGLEGGSTYSVSPGLLTQHRDADELNLALGVNRQWNDARTAYEARTLNDKDFLFVLGTFGLGQYTLEQIKNLPAGGQLRADWLTPAGGSVDLRSVLDAITAVAVPTAAEIATAVNDDAAVRLQS